MNFRISSVLHAALVLALLPQARANDTASAWTKVNDDDAAATYSPGMQASESGGYYWGDMHGSQTPGDWAQFSFTGTGVKWIGSKNADHGEADVYLDGKLDATLATTAPTWLQQQEIYTKTGLKLGPHTLRIVLKTAGYTDVDAFAFQRPGKPEPALENLPLPPQQPLLKPATRYAIGNGVGAVVCDPNGRIETAFGPGYTMPDLTGGEDFAVELDHQTLSPQIEMKRAAETGVFYDITSHRDFTLALIDYACRNQPWVSRLIVLRNTSKTKIHTVTLSATIWPRNDKGYVNQIAADKSGHPTGFTAQEDTSIGIWSPIFLNPVDKSVLIAFDEPGSSAVYDGKVATIQTPTITLKPGEQHEISLTHYFRAGHAMSDAEAVAALRAIPARANLQKSLAEWKKWFEDVPPAYALSRVKDPRGRVLMEGALAILKTNQSTDGGVIAHTTYYKEGYIRDAAMAIRGLLAAGHTEEAKQWLVWCNRKLAVHGHFGDAMTCSVSLDDKSSSLDQGNLSAEEPGWVLLCARDYYAQTHDLAFLKSIDHMLRYAAEVQLQEFEANGGKIGFNGDETEICGAVDFTATGVRNVSTWSLSSVAMAAASVDFFKDYIKASGGDPAHYSNSQTKTTMDLGAEVRKMSAAMARDFWRTDVPEIPGGFHDFARVKDGGAWPKARLVNLTLMPVFFGTDYPHEEKVKDVTAMAQYFDPKSGFLQLVPGANTGSEGQDLGYLLWDLTEMNDPRKDEVYNALVNGKTSDAWGGYSESYTSDGIPNGHDMRSLETGINVSALAKYWGLGRGN